MDRLDYALKRLLLVIPTFLGITVLCYGICLLMPGGPVEQAVYRMRAMDGTGRGGVVSRGVSERQVEEIRRQYEFDRPFLEQYWHWLVRDRLGLAKKSFQYPERSAWDLVSSRFSVSLVFGVTGFLLTYLVCIPLGIAKAVRDGSGFDLASSVLVFTGYAIPVFAFGMMLKMLFCGTNDWSWNLLPVAGFTSDGFAGLGFWGQCGDLARHMALPLLCYMVGGFAVQTLLMKNALLEEIGKDYVRTVLARGGSMRRAVWGHALRGALIPIATGFGGVLTIMFAGSVLIETVFEIPGMGRLSLQALEQRDYAVFMGILSLTSILGLAGNFLSDFCYVLIDPRIDFSKGG